MKKFSFLMISVLAAAALIAANIWLSRNNGYSPAGSEIYKAYDISTTSTIAAINAAANGTKVDTVSADSSVSSSVAISSAFNSATNEINPAGSTMNNDILIQNLDKTTDETINYVYTKSPKNITIGSIYEGNFTSSGKPELLVIFKLLEMPHAGGLDCSVAAVYDKATLGIITQRTFTFDDCKFSVVEDEAKKGYLLFVGSTTYQGYSDYSLGLWKPGSIWENMQPADTTGVLDDRKYELKADGTVWVSRPVFSNTETQETSWVHEFNLVWNSRTHLLDAQIPANYKDEKGNPNVDAVSVSPDGSYAISTRLDKYELILYDLQKNALASEFAMLAQDYGFMWSPDSTKVCVTRAARIWIESSILLVGTKKVQELPNIAEIINVFKGQGLKLDYILNENRPDPYITPIEWSPDSTRLLMFYQWTDSKYNRRSGTFVFDTVSGDISKVTQNNADPEGDNIPASKPEGFKW